MKSETIFALTMRASKSRITKERGRGFYALFSKGSRRILEEVLPQVPDIGKTLFRFNYDFGVCYIAWYKQLIAMGVGKDEAVREMWSLTGDFLHLIPRPVMKLAAPFYLRGWRKNAPVLEKLGNEGRLHPFDFKIRYREIDRNTIEVDFYECGMKKLFAKFDTLDLMPGVCRIDYLIFNYMGIGFVRDKTLGDGNDCCNGWYSIKGCCEWAPEKGFADRK